jgi:hypothetical protein
MQEKIKIFFNNPYRTIFRPDKCSVQITRRHDFQQNVSSKFLYLIQLSGRNQKQTWAGSPLWRLLFLFPQWSQ